MTFLEKASLLLVLLTLKEGQFSYYLQSKKYTAVISESTHTAPLAKFSLGQALSLVNQLASGVPTSITVRIGANDYTLVTSPA